MPELKLKPITVDKKTDQKNIVFTKTFFSSTSLPNQVQLREKSLGQWSIEREERCNICWVNIKQGEPFTRCTSCNNKFHEDHWKEWIRSKQSCPICKVRILH